MERCVVIQPVSVCLADCAHLRAECRGVFVVHHIPDTEEVDHIVIGGRILAVHCGELAASSQQRLLDG